ncbi:sensor histidine kinase [Deinococcus pimensis]|uniref:sensor histidine kinase n=1 Tax=Deinococcus pimensis TaxID=309888 RepID=UPI0004AF8471|nr:PAS domain-containing protein [Deinococcus pimensis]
MTDVVPAWVVSVLNALAVPACVSDEAGLVLGTNAPYDGTPGLPPRGRSLRGLTPEEAGRSDVPAPDRPLVRGVRLEGGERRWSTGALGEGLCLHTFEGRAERTAESTVLREAFEHAPVGWAVFDADARYLLVNEHLARMNGLPVEAHLGRTVGELLPELPEDVARRLEDTIRTGVAVPAVEVSGRTPASPDASRLWTVEQYPLRDDEGRVIGAAGMATEVTDRRRAERALEEQARTLGEQAELLALANETVILRDPESRVRGWNEAAYRMYGYTGDEARGRVTHDLLRTVFPVSKEAVDLALEREGFWEGELTHRTRDDREVVVLSRQAARRDASGRIGAILEINWDITDRKRAEERLAELARTLERRVDERTAQLSVINSELEAFVYTVAHDLRSPLRSISGFASAVREDYGERLDDEGRSMLGRIERSAERLDELIRDLLAYSRLGRTDLTLAPVDLDEVVERALGDLGREVHERDAVVTVAPHLGRVMAHEATLLQVVLNLLSNALKFVAPGGRPEVRVRSERVGERVRVWVEDNGIGVEPRHEQRIFRVFERLHTLREYPGTGVGLAIVERGLSRMDGEVGVRAGEAGGSRFWFELRAAEEDL